MNSEFSVLILPFMKNNRGFSIVAVLVAAGIMGFLALVFSKMILNSKKGQKSVENSLDFDVLKTTTKMILNKKSLCDNAFRSSGTAATFNPTLLPQSNFNEIRLGTQIVASPSMTLGGGLVIDKLELSQVSGTVPDTITIPSKTIYPVELVISALKKTSGVGGSTLSNKFNPFRFLIQVDYDSIALTGSRQIEACWLADGAVPQSYTAWGTLSCGSGYIPAYTGLAVVAIHTAQAGGAPICKQGGGFANTNGFYWSSGTTHGYADISCAVCVGGTYTGWGTSTCASGFTVAYTGFATIPIWSNWVTATPICKRGPLTYPNPGGFNWATGGTWATAGTINIPCVQCLK